LRLNVNSKIYDNLMWFLKRFTREELEIIDETELFESAKAYLNSELKRVESGKADFIDLELMDTELENTIRKYEG